MFGKLLKKRVYLDYAAATPLLPEAKAAMNPYLTNDFGNPSAIHSEGLRAKQAVEHAREQTARAFHVRPEFVTFVSGGTEANNLAILGSLRSLAHKGLPFAEMEVVTTKIEHPSVLEVMKELERLGVVIKYVPLDEHGLVQLASLKEMLSAKTVLFTVAYANSEIGTVQKLHSIKKVLHEAEQKFGTTILLHVDAAQAPLWLNCQFDALKVDLLSLDAGKCNGPKGIGALIRSRRVSLSPSMFGGGQEEGLRPGTENVAGIVGAGVAFLHAQESYKQRAQSVASLRDASIQLLLKEIPRAILNGPAGEQRLANNVNISIPGLDTEFATVVLDTHGFAVSTKSACAGAGGGESVVVREISGDPTRASATLRISLSPETKLSDLKRLSKVLKSHVEKIRSFDLR